MGLDEENYAVKEMSLYLKKPAEIRNRKGGFWDNEKMLICFVVYFLW